MVCVATPVPIPSPTRLVLLLTGLGAVVAPTAHAEHLVASCGPADAPLAVAAPAALAQPFTITRRARLDRLVLELSDTAAGSATVAITRLAGDTPSDADVVLATGTLSLPPGMPTERVVTWPHMPILDAGEYAMVVEPGPTGHIAWARCSRADGAVALLRTPTSWVALPATRFAFRLEGATVDDRSPETTITAAPPPLSNLAAPTFTFEADGPATFVCTLDDGEPFACVSPLALTVPDDGPHRLRVAGRDATGAVDQSPAEAVFTLDRRAPVLTVERVGPDLAGPPGTVAIGFAADEIATFTCALDDAPPAECGTPWHAVLSDDAPHAVRITARDEAGNEARVTVPIARDLAPA
jgi:hypothetical protein